MKKIILILPLAIFITALHGCATKNYGRQGVLTQYESDTMSCREIDLEIAKVRGFMDHINDESAFSGRDVLAILGDFGIGNSLERKAAIESAQQRMQALHTLKSRKSCNQK
ncbi:hypothetical protein [Sansalvadorimonas verongulae]|uniref:hypothetical protein n=1 Tax=Sansalvadorimonas verongulae TaxID=2172824 RepID=UPI0012BD14B0|nr:hypothetical protein [Sansalvadorimonas verongulae]MTI12019.1 hypothetical protein [Sansalvadorimonas verongulae]